MSADHTAHDELLELLSLDDTGPAKRMGSNASAAILGSALDAWEAMPLPSGSPDVSGPQLAAPDPVSGSAATSGSSVATGAAIGSAVTAALMAALWLTAGDPEPAGQPAAAMAPAESESAVGDRLSDSVAGDRLSESESDSASDSASESESASDSASASESASESESASDSSSDSGATVDRPRPARVDVEDLMAEANALRGEGAWARAEATYLRASRARPGSGTAHVADVAAAGIRLDQRRDPRGAIRLYRRALRTGGPLAVESREGLARAFRALGRADAERDALADLLARHSGSRAARHARQRLQELEGR